MLLIKQVSERFLLSLSLLPLQCIPRIIAKQQFATLLILATKFVLDKGKDLKKPFVLIAT